MIRRLAPAAALLAWSAGPYACFDSAPVVGDGPASSGGSGSGSGSTSGGGSSCEQGIALPKLPLGWDGFAWVAVGTTGAKPLECPQGTSAQVRFIGTLDPDPKCSCACEAAVCGATYSTGPGCDSLQMHGELPECAAAPAMASAIDLQTHVMEPDCEASATPLPGPEAVPVSVCTSPVGTGACVPVPEGYMGPCIEGDLPCPDGYSEVAAAAVEVECNACDACNAETFCNALGFEVFASDDCSGTPFGMVGGGDNCIVEEGFGSVRVAPINLVDPGCPGANASTDEHRICCLDGA